MAVCAAWLLYSGRNTTFATDGVYYYARFVAHGFTAIPTGGVEYFLAPHNGHLVLVGKLVYRALLLTFGTDYLAFRVVNVAAVLLCVGLFFVIARRRVGPLAALIPAILLLFLGYAYETLLWPFNMHTTLSLALGLAAILALEREDRTGDRLACGFLVLSTATVELGLAFTVGAAVSVLLRPDRMRRLWIFAIPVVLYAAWWLWAQHFDQSDTSIRNVHLIAITVANGLAAVMGSIFGVNPTGPEIQPQLTTVTAWGAVLGGGLVVALALRVRRRGVPPTFWVFTAVLLTYWVTIAIGGRAPDSSRYIFVGALLVFLIVADALRGVSLGWPVLVGAACVALVAIPANLAKFYDGRRLFLNDAAATRTEYGVLELIRDQVAPGYMPGADPKVVEQGGGVGAPLSAAEYFRASGEFGSLGYSPQQIREEPLQWRQVADATLVSGLGLELAPATAPASRKGCEPSTEGTAEAPVFFDLPPGGLLLGSRSAAPVTVSVFRFGVGGPGIELGQLPAGGWATLALPSGAAGKSIKAVVNGPVERCPPG